MPFYFLSSSQNDCRSEDSRSPRLILYHSFLLAAAQLFTYHDVPFDVVSPTLALFSASFGGYVIISFFLCLFAFCRLYRTPSLSISLIFFYLCSTAWFFCPFLASCDSSGPYHFVPCYFQNLSLLIGRIPIIPVFYSSFFIFYPLYRLVPGAGHTSNDSV